jgi:hypothetical protein
VSRKQIWENPEGATPELRPQGIELRWVALQLSSLTTTLRARLQYFLGGKLILSTAVLPWWQTDLPNYNTN